MANVDLNKFIDTVHQLNNYGKNGCEEIHFQIKDGNEIPILTKKPNWFFRLIRWLFKGGYHEQNSIKKTVDFLEKNHIHDQQTDIKPLKRLLFKKIKNSKDKKDLEIRFKNLINKTMEIAKKEKVINKKKLPSKLKRKNIPSKKDKNKINAIKKDGKKIEFLKKDKEKIKIVIKDKEKIDSVINEEQIEHEIDLINELNLKSFIEASPISSIDREEIAPEEIDPPKPYTINVPDDGNCLFYALSIGLRKKYEDFPQIQNQLQWEVNVEQLADDLSASKELLKNPGKLLRKQAAKYLEDHQFDEEIMLVLIEGIGSAIEAMNKEIAEEMDVVLFIKEEIAELENQPKFLVEDFLEEKRNELKFKEESIRLTKANRPSEDNSKDYIDMTKKDGVYCGVAQIVALSKFYQIPIRVLYKYGSDNEYEQVFNNQVFNNIDMNIGKNHPLPILTIAHVNGNHFKFVND